MSHFRPLIGHILIQVVVVDGPPGTSARFAPGESAAALRDVYSGLGILRQLGQDWARAQPVPVREMFGFSVDSTTVTLSLDPHELEIAPDEVPARRDDVWLPLAARALRTKLSLGTDDLAKQMAELRQKLRRTTVFGLRVADAAVLFLTKYPVHHSAWAVSEGGDYAVVGMSPVTKSERDSKRRRRVVAHELAHLFDAPDEYGLGETGRVMCEASDNVGFFDTRNENCEFIVAPSAGLPAVVNPHQVPCLMNELELIALCPQSPGHLGWVDDDRDGVLDLARPATIQLSTHAARPFTGVVITGNNLWDTRSILFNDVETTAFDLRGANPDLPVNPADPLHVSVSVLVPRVPNGIYTVRVVTRAGPSTGSVDDTFLLVVDDFPQPTGDPVVWGVVPRFGRAGTTVRVVGKGLVGVTSVTFGGVQADMSTFVQSPLIFPDEDTFTIQAPAGPVGTVPVVVTRDDGAASPPFPGFADVTYPRPTTGTTPTPATTPAPADDEHGLLPSVLQFARDRLASLVNTGADALVNLLTGGAGASPAAGGAGSHTPPALAGPVAGAAGFPALPAAAGAPALAVPAALAQDVANDLAKARAELTAATGAPTNVLAHLAVALAALRSACQRAAAALPAAGTADQALARAITSATAGPRGLAAQLRLPASWPWTVSGPVARAEVHGPDTPVELAGVLALRRPVLTVQFDWALPRLTVTLTAEATVRFAADALVGALSSGAGADVKATLTVRVDSFDGVGVGGGTATRVRLPATVSNALLALRDLTFGLPERDFELAVDLTGSLGPVAVHIQGAGVILTVDPAAATPLAVKARPPDGAGLEVNAAVVRGGGFAARRGSTYHGVLDLVIGPVRAQAIVLIGTEPDFSLLLMLFARFAAPIQLSFGFTLNAVGGLLAVNRGLSSDAMIAGVGDGTADVLLFPDDPERVDAGLLERLFPARSGTVVVGPAFELGWGSPISFLTAKVGVFLQLPAPKLVLLGALRVALPSPQAPIVDLRAGVYGEITPERALVLVSLAGSRMAGFTLSGDLGLLFGYGANPRFAVSAGGFHPGYAGPPELSALRRVTVDMSPPALLTLRAEAYVALTSNAFMLGARVEAGIDFGVADARGYLAFDAIVLWAPFHFEVDIRAGIAVRALGETFASIALALHLEGPGRWVAHGTATLQLSFLPDIDLEVGPLTWGTSADPPPPLASPLAVLRAELARPSAWEVLPPDGAEHLVTLRDATPAAGSLFAHPLGGVGVRQRAVPLGVRIDQLGGRPVSEHLLTLGPPTLAGTAGATATGAAPVTDLFAPGLYLNLTDEQKLSRPAFEPFTSGALATGLGAARFGTARQTDYRWETVFPHRADLPTVAGDAAQLTQKQAAQALAASPVGRAAAANPYRVAGTPLAPIGDMP